MPPINEVTAVTAPDGSTVVPADTLAPAPEIEAEGFTSTIPVITPDERNAALRAIYSAASKELRETYIDEFNAIRKRMADERGLDWDVPSSKKEKVLAQIEKLIAESGLDVALVKGNV